MKIRWWMWSVLDIKLLYVYKVVLIIGSGILYIVEEF